MLSDALNENDTISLLSLSILIGSYPTWPTDFNWNTNGLPDSCNCQACGCACVNVNEPSAGVEWSGNWLCHKKTKISPNIEWSHKGIS